MLLIGHFRSGTALVEARYQGALIAPKGKLSLATVANGHRGAFPAKQIEVNACVPIEYREAPATG